jgi:hypothetical protein
LEKAPAQAVRRPTDCLWRQGHQQPELVQVSRINQDEMKTLMTGVVNRIHTFLARTLFSATEDKAFERALERAAAPWTRGWDEPKYLADFLMPHSEKLE